MINEKLPFSKSFTCSFKSPCLPNDLIQFDTKIVSGIQKVKILSDAKVKALISITNSYAFPSDLAYIDPRLITNKKFGFIHAKEITFLHQYLLMSRNQNQISASGKYIAGDNRKYFATEFSVSSNFGMFFELIEFMGLTCLAANHEAGILSSTDLYGFVKFTGFQVKRPIREKEVLTCFIRSEKDDIALSWSGYITSGSEIIAVVENVLSILIKED